MNIFDANPNQIIVATGSRKTAAIKEIVAGALAQGDRAVILDGDGHFTKAFYDAQRGDKIFSSFNPLSSNWDIFGEIGSVKDVYQLVYSLVPDTGNAADREWRDYARTFVIDAVLSLWDAGNIEEGRTGTHSKHHTLQELNRVLTEAPVEELAILLNGTPTKAFLTSANAKLFRSIRMIAASALRTLQYLDRPGAAAFSLREWVKQEWVGNAPGEGGVLFIPYSASEAVMCRDMFLVAVALALSEAKSRTDNQHRLLVLDDLDSLGRVEGFLEDLAEFRRSGGRVILHIDSIEHFKTLSAGKANVILETGLIL